MSPANKKFCEENIDHLNRAYGDYMRGISEHFKIGVVKVLSEEFRPGYTMPCGTCDKDILQMIKILAIHFFQWRDAQPVIVEANFPKHDKPEQ